MVRMGAIRALLASALALAVLAGCGGLPGGMGQPPAPLPSSTPDVGSGQLHGAGGTFPAPFYLKGFDAYAKAHPGISTAYDAIGSSGGIQKFTQQAVDFGASDVPLTDSELQAAGGDGSLIQLPTTVGVVGVAYNLPGIHTLRLDGPTLADIYLGRITRWNDDTLKLLNPAAQLPDAPITVAHRADGSGTTFAFTDYLSKVSEEWKTKVGASKVVSWPAGAGATGNPGVAQQVQAKQGAIGYVELAYVVQAGLQVALLQNRSGTWVEPTPAGGTAAAAGLIGASAKNFSITDGGGVDAYPIATMSWVIIRTAQPDLARARAVVYLWRWMITDGQRYARDLQYAPLSGDIQNFGLVQLTKVTVGGKPIMPYLEST